ncbi:MAG: hypothetical protein ACRDT6_18900, partial [Micromonosporaceae bacterium]
MTELDTIKAAAGAAGNAIDAAKGQVLAALAVAQEKTQQLAGLGLEGVARTVMAAQSALEAAPSLGSAHDAGNGAVSTLAETTDPSRIGETVQRLATVVGQLDQAASGVETATGSIHQAYNYAQQAEVNSVTAVVGA